MSRLNRIQIKGFKSIREMDLELHPINVLIGANGSGKSNLIGALSLVNQIVDENLQIHIGQIGGAGHILHFGRKNTQEIILNLYFGLNSYEIQLIPTDDNRFIFGKENFVLRTHRGPFEVHPLDSGHKETQIRNFVRHQVSDIATNVLLSLEGLEVYHFQDTSESARVKQTPHLSDNHYLRSDAYNLASMLYLFQETQPQYFSLLVKAIRLAAPFLDRFVLQPTPENTNIIRLQWLHKNSDMLFDVSDLSDGTLRFICLTALLMQPNPPAIIVIDEPELGLHPYAETLFASMVKNVAARGHQVIISTQSVRLVDEFDPEDIVVVEWNDNQSVFKRQSTKELADWLEDYSLGELWEKNILGGRP